MSIEDFLAEDKRRAAASELSLREVEVRLRVDLPGDYKQFLRVSDGFMGSVGGNYFHLWSVSELVDRNVEYDVAACAPGITLIGTDGGGEGYGFRTIGDRVEYVILPLIGMDEIDVVGTSIVELLERGASVLDGVGG